MKCQFAQFEKLSAVKEEIFVGENFCTFPSKRFVWNLISYSEIDQNKEKLEETIERPAKQVEEKLVWKLISYIFQLYEATKLNSLRKFLLLQYLIFSQALEWK